MKSRAITTLSLAGLIGAGAMQGCEDMNFDLSSPEGLAGMSAIFGANSYLADTPQKAAAWGALSRMTEINAHNQGRLEAAKVGGGYNGIHDPYSEGREVWDNSLNDGEGGYRTIYPK